MITLIEAHPLLVINGRFLQELTQTFSLGLDSQRRLALVAEEAQEMHYQQVSLWRVPMVGVGHSLYSTLDSVAEEAQVGLWRVPTPMVGWVGLYSILVLPLMGKRLVSLEGRSLAR